MRAFGDEQAQACGSEDDPHEPSLWAVPTWASQASDKETRTRLLAILPMHVRIVPAEAFAVPSGATPELLPLMFRLKPDRVSIPLRRAAS